MAKKYMVYYKIWDKWIEGSKPMSLKKCQDRLNQEAQEALKHGGDPLTEYKIEEVK